VVVLVAPCSWLVSLEGVGAHTLHTDIISTYYGCLLQTKAHIEKIFETSTILQIAVTCFLWPGPLRIYDGTRKTRRCQIPEFVVYSITTLLLTQHVHTVQTAHAASFLKRFVEQNSVRVDDKIIYKKLAKMLYTIISSFE